MDLTSINYLNYNKVTYEKSLNFNYNFVGDDYNINENINIELNSYYEQYDINLNTHYLHTNTIHNVPHIVLENSFNNDTSQSDGFNKIYSTVEGNFKIDFENIYYKD